MKAEDITEPTSAATTLFHITTKPQHLTFLTVIYIFSEDLKNFIL